MNTLGIIIGRMQPPTVGHTTLIDMSLRENNTTLVLLGGDGKINKNNPLSFEVRDELLQTQYPDQNLMIDYILDTQNDETWVNNISEKIHSFGLYSNINFYAGDLKNDSAILAIKQFEANLLIDNIKYNETSRSKVTTMYNEKQTPVSATLVRTAISEGRFDEITRAIPKNIRKEVKSLFSE